MLRMLLALAVLCQTANAQDSRLADKPAVITTSWFVVGNGFPGVFNMQVYEDDSIKGDIYHDSIRGQYNPKTEQFVFERLAAPTDSHGVQKWEGKLVKTKDAQSASEISGTFVSLGDPRYGTAGQSYEFSGKLIGSHEIVEGMSPPTSIVAKFVTGPYADSTACPTLGFRRNKKIAVFARTMDPQIVKLAEMVDGIVTQDESLARSFLFLSHENDPTPTPAEYEQMVGSLKTTLTERGIKHLSAGVMIRVPKVNGPTRAKASVGIFSDDDVVVMVIRPDSQQPYGKITYLKFFKTNEVTENLIEQLSAELREVAKDKP